MADPELQIDAYLAYLGAEKQYSTHTQQAYRRQLEHSLRDCPQAQAGWQNLDIHVFRGLLAHWHRQGLAPASIHQRLCALRGLYRYLMRERLAEVNPLDSLSAPKMPRRLPKDISVDDVFMLLDNMPVDDSLAIRDRAILELFYSCGLRLSELANMNINSLDVRGREVSVFGKGSKQRQVPVGSKALDALDAWFLERPEWPGAHEPALFISRQGKRLSVRSIQARLKLWGQRLGLAGNLHPHKLRHAFATHMLEGSGDLRAVQELLGHANLATTQVYTHLDFQHLAKVYDAAHPRARKKNS